MEVIHKSLIGSRAHGLHNEDSDYDYRYIYVEPTKNILSLGYKEKTTNTIIDKDDSVYYEIGHFLKLATKANPTVLELLTKDSNLLTTKYSEELIDLLPKLYNPRDAYNAFTGYSHNQQKIFNRATDRVKYKFAVARIRTLFNLCELLQHGKYMLECKDTVILDYLLKVKNGEVADSHILLLSQNLQTRANTLLRKVENKQDLLAINDFLLRVRKDFY